MLPEDVVAVAELFRLPLDRLHLFRADRLVRVHDRHGRGRPGARSIKNCWITCGYIQEEPLAELCRVTDAANVNLKSFSEEIYRELNTGKLEPILRHAQDAQAAGRVVRGDQPGGAHLHRQAGDDPADVRLAGGEPGPGLSAALLPLSPGAQADAPAADAGGDTCWRRGRSPARPGCTTSTSAIAREVADGETTFCPNCRKPVVEREHFAVVVMRIAGGKCGLCGTPIPGVWAG